MREDSGGATEIRIPLERHRAGDPAAREELLAVAADRLTRLARKMLRMNPRVARWEQTDDVVQDAALQLFRALETIRPESERSFFNLAALKIRHTLIDMARHYHGPQGAGAHHESLTRDAEASPQVAGPADQTHDPAPLAAWTEFHRAIDALPDEDRELFDLLWYHDQTQAEAARILGITERVLGTRWRQARIRLHRALGDALPGA
ncbi:MAG: sigma-70 family RNA polymerase sigma factor [Isosphaeraceae bacterium]